MQKQVTLVLSFVCVLALVTFTGCGDDGDDDGNGSSSTVSQPDFNASVAGVEDNSEAGGLTEDQTRELCEQFNAYVSSELSNEELQNFSCTLNGIFASAFATESGGDPIAICNEARTACLMAEPTNDEGFEGGCENATISDQCMATVAEIEACFFDQINALNTLANTLTCEAGMGDGASLGVQEESAACKVIEEKCPEILEDDGGGSSNGTSTSNGTSGSSCSQSPGPDCCIFANDGECDEPNFCDAGTDTTDCS